MSENENLSQKIKTELLQEGLLKLVEDTKNDLKETEKNLNCLLEASRNPTDKKENPPKILIIDDNEHFLALTKWSLENENVITVTATSADCASLIIKERPDILLIDINMPAVKGHDMAEILIQMPLLIEGFVILHSGIGETEVKNLADQCGAHGYILKQDNPEAFLEKIRFWIDKIPVKNNR